MSTTRTVEAAFSIDDWQETVYDEPAEGPKLTRVTLRKTYRGEIDGTSSAEVLTAQGETAGGYVASERVVGTYDGKSGSFVVQHTGRRDQEANQAVSGVIVPGSGTGELAAIAGEAEESREGVLTLRLTSF